MEPISSPRIESRQRQQQQQQQQHWMQLSMRPMLVASAQNVLVNWDQLFKQGQTKQAMLLVFFCLVAC